MQYSVYDSLYISNPNPRRAGSDGLIFGAPYTYVLIYW